MQVRVLRPLVTARRYQMDPANRLDEARRIENVHSLR